MNINELKTLWKEHEFRPAKRLGQNFLIDKNVRNNILNEAKLTDESIVVEIGAGFGVMSLEVAERCKRLFAVEKDKKICSIMSPIFGKVSNIELVCDDVLDLDICSLTREGRKLIILGNIPYYITTPVIEKIIRQRQCIERVEIVIQDEVASRIVAAPGSKDYGALTCFIQFYAKPEKVFKISKNSFYPRPKVDSCLLKLEILHKPEIQVRDKDVMFKIIRKAFSQRRKKVLNSLSHGKFLSLEKENWKEVLNDCGIDISSRAEDLSLYDYARISDRLE
jgi:16S rRNA (adenine1518-N6/adenine1519-N6)-dimethyltransferase